MEDYKQRVVNEKDALDEKLNALTVFLDGDNETGVSAEEVERMQRQQAIMANYSAVLDERISAFN